MLPLDDRNKKFDIKLGCKMTFELMSGDVEPDNEYHCAIAFVPGEGFHWADCFLHKWRSRITHKEIKVIEWLKLIKVENKLLNQ